MRPLWCQRDSTYPNPLVRACCSIALDRIAVWHMLWPHWIYDNLTPPSEQFFVSTIWVGKADGVAVMTWVAYPVSQSLWHGNLRFFVCKKDGAGAILCTIWVGNATQSKSQFSLCQSTLEQCAPKNRCMFHLYDITGSQTPSLHSTIFRPIMIGAPALSPQ